MNWFTDRHCFLLAVAIYGASAVYSVFLWRKGFRKDDHVNYFLLLAAFALHTVAMAERGFSDGPLPGQQSLRGHDVCRMDDCDGVSGHRPVAAAAVPGRVRVAGAVCHRRVCADARTGPHPRGPQPQFSGALVSLHAATILLAYGAFGLGAVASAMFLMQQHDLKFHKLRAVLSLFPSIQRLEIVAVRLVFAGFMSADHRS